MIRLQKAVPSQELTAKIAKRTEEFLQLRGQGAPVPDALANSYKAADVKALLRAETADKCAYCESKISHVDFGDVEHIIPKVIHPELRYEYSNLTYACGVCNTKKGQYHDVDTPLVNPYLDDPEEHFIAAGPMVLRRQTSDRGLITEKRLLLNRPALVERRTERLEAVATLIDQKARTENNAIRLVLIEQIRQEYGKDKEYSFVVQGYVKAVERLEE